jgi:hypothetical protein
MSDTDLERKFAGLADGVVPASQAKQVMDLCWTIATLPDAAALAKATATI